MAQESAEIADMDLLIRIIVVVLSARLIGILIGLKMIIINV